MSFLYSKREVKSDPGQTLNIEIKARCSAPALIRQKLEHLNARFHGLDHQVDTYFRVREGRLKLRQGTIENNLIFYNRADQQGPKLSTFDLIKIPDAGTFIKVMEQATGILVRVEKRRQIWYLDHIKGHIDEVPGLGNFVEIEAYNDAGQITATQLHEDVEQLMENLGIEQTHLEAGSYSDLILDQQRNNR